MIFLVLIATSLSKLAITEQLVDYINSLPGNTWTAKIPDQLADLTEEDLRSMVMAETLFDMEDELPYQEVALDDPIPKQWSFYDVAPQCKTPVLSPARCFGDWALSTLVSFGDRRCMAGLDPDPVVYSMQYLISCGARNGCDGGYLPGAWKYLNTNGVPTSECVPYSNHTHDDGVPGACPTECADGTALELVKASGGITNVGKNNVTNIQKAILKYGPVIAKMHIYIDFIGYSSGIYHHKSNTSAGRLYVTILGWGVHRNVDYWVIRNTWGPRWGEDGYMRIVRGTNECDVEKYVVSGEI